MIHSPIFYHALIDPMFDIREHDTIVENSDILGNLDTTLSLSVVTSSFENFLNQVDIYIPQLSGPIDSGIESLQIGLELNESIKAVVDFITWIFKKIYGFVAWILSIIKKIFTKVFSIDNKISMIVNTKLKILKGKINSITNIEQKKKLAELFANTEISQMCTNNEFIQLTERFCNLSNTVLQGTETIAAQLKSLQVEHPEFPVWLTKGFIETSALVGIDIYGYKVTYHSPFSKYEIAPLSSLGYDLTNVMSVFDVHCKKMNTAFDKFEKLPSIINTLSNQLKVHESQLKIDSTVNRPVVIKNVTVLQNQMNLCIRLFAAIEQLHSTINYRTKTLCACIEKAIKYLNIIK